MNYKKAQKDIFARLVKGDRVVKVEACEPCVILSDGMAGWVFHEDKNYIDLNKIPGPGARVHLDIVSEENLLTMTNTLKSYKGLTLRQFIDFAGSPIYVQETYLRNFDSEPRFYQELSNGPIVVTERDVTDHEQIVGFVMPVKYTENEF